MCQSYIDFGQRVFEKRKNPELTTEFLIKGELPPDKWRHVNTSKISRRFHCAFPLQWLGFLRDWTDEKKTFDDKLELSIRFGSNEDLLHETLDGREVRTRYPCAIIKIPGIPHTQEICAPRDSVFFQYDPALTDPMRKAGLLEPPWIWECRLTPTLSGQLRLVDELLDRSGEDGVIDRLDLLALQIWQDLLIDRGRDTDQTVARLRRICAWLQLHFTEKIDYDELARKNGFSRRAFYRSWSGCFRQTPAQYVLDLRLEEACRRLADTRQKIWEIAAALNFEHSEYFCYVFRKKYGLTPLRYREERRDGKNTF